MATLVDFFMLIVVITALAGSAVYLFRLHGSVDPFLAIAFLVSYLLYGSALVARNGRTPGQSLFELEVVDVATSSSPTLGRAGLRIVVPMAGPLADVMIDMVLGRYGYELDTIPTLAFKATYCLVPAALLWASLRSVGKQTFWDKLSRTMVRYRTRRTTAI